MADETKAESVTAVEAGETAQAAQAAQTAVEGVTDDPAKRIAALEAALSDCTVALAANIDDSGALAERIDALEAAANATGAEPPQDVKAAEAAELAAVKAQADADRKDIAADEKAAVDAVKRRYAAHLF